MKFFMKNKTPSVPIGYTEEIELSGVKVNLRPIVLRESLLLSKIFQRDSFFTFVENFLTMITNLSTDTIKSLPIQDCVALALYHRMYFWDNLILCEGPQLTPKSFIKEPTHQGVVVEVNKLKFTNRPTLEVMQKAEKTCYAKGDLEFLSYYLVGGCCMTKTSGETVDYILGSVDDPKLRIGLDTLRSAIYQAGYVFLDFFYTTDKVGLVSSDKRNIITLDDEAIFLGIGRVEALVLGNEHGWNTEPVDAAKLQELQEINDEDQAG